jgi:hypothetical protein
MMIADISLLFDVALTALLAVMIFYAVRLNKRIAMLRDGEGEMQQMIAKFSESSLVAQESARLLKAAGTEAEFGVKAAIAKGMALRNDLEMMLDEAELLVDRLDDDRYKVPPAPSARDIDRDTQRENHRDTHRDTRRDTQGDLQGSAPERPVAQRAGAQAAQTPEPAMRNRNITPFSPPIRSAEEVVRAETRAPETGIDEAASAGLEPRTEAERHLLDAIRAAKQGVA